MQFSLSNSHRKRPKRRKVVVFYYGAIVLGVWLVIASFGGGAGDFSFRVTNPLRATAGFASAVTRRIGAFFTASGTYSTHIAELEDENRQLRERAAMNDQLRSEIGAVAIRRDIDPARENAVIARVIGKGSHVFGQEILVDRGGIVGVRAGDTVVFGERTLVGQVSFVTGLYSRVTIIGNRDFRAAGKVADEIITNADSALPTMKRTGIVRGEGFGAVSFDMVDPAALINEGDTVVTSGFDGMFPPGYLVGKISRITSSPSDFFQKASLRLALDMGEVEVVTILKSL